MGLFGIGGVVGDMLDFGANLATNGAYGNQQASIQNNAKQIELSREQMAFQERMSNSAYQRAMDDMRKAGLNPMLAADNGGASTPSGAMAQLTAPRPGDIAAGLGNSAKEVINLTADTKKKNSETDLNQATKDLNGELQEKAAANAEESRQNAQLSAQQHQTEVARTRSANADAETKEALLPLVKERATIDKSMLNYDAVMDRVSQALGTINTGRNAFRRNPEYNSESTTYNPRTGEVTKETSRKGR